MTKSNADQLKDHRLLSQAELATLTGMHKSSILRSSIWETYKKRYVRIYLVGPVPESTIKGTDWLIDTEIPEVKAFIEKKCSKIV